MVALSAAGVAAGFLNTMAGGGSLLTLPVLMLLGLPADVANGTNRLSVLSQSVSGLVGFARAGKLDRRGLPAVVVPAALGSLLGAAAASVSPRWLLKPALLAAMVAVAIAMTLKPKAGAAPKGEGGEAGEAAPPRGFGALALFGAGLYGGFVQAGVGFLLLAALGTLLRYDLVRANALKLACTAAFGALSLAVFASAGQVAWKPALVLALATVVGSQLGVRFALSAKPSTLRLIVLGCVSATSVAALFKGGP